MTATENTPSLSILIPRYNFDMNELVEDLLHQADELNIEFEIRVVDDASPLSNQWRQTILQHPKFIFEQLSENIGRSRIRNYLASQARYAYLLFLDCDSKIPPLFLEKYLAATTTSSIVAGGTAYSENPPSNPLLHLHWQYGRKVETKALQKNELFHSNNFLIDRKLFAKVGFDEQVSGYGHEDTFFRIALQRLKINIRKIDNPVCHIGLNTTSDFLRNTRNAVDNLMLHPQYMPTHPIIRLHRISRKLQLSRPFQSLFTAVAPSMESKLEQRNPHIMLFNAYKLLYILSR